MCDRLWVYRQRRMTLNDGRRRRRRATYCMIELTQARDAPARLPFDGHINVTVANRESRR